MKIDQQIEMMELLQKCNENEQKIWLKQGATGTASACKQYAKACAEVIKSLKRLKKLEKCFLPLKDAF
jgi:hypothetical protein